MVLSSSLARFPNLANSGVKIIIDFTIIYIIVGLMRKLKNVIQRLLSGITRSGLIRRLETAIRSIDSIQIPDIRNAIREIQIAIRSMDAEWRPQAIRELERAIRTIVEAGMQELRRLGQAIQDLQNAIDSIRTRTQEQMPDLRNVFRSVAEWWSDLWSTCQRIKEWLGDNIEEQLTDLERRARDTIRNTDILAVDKAAEIIAGLGIPGLVLVMLMAASPWVGAAAMTASLAALGPFGMLGGIATLGVLALISRALAEFGFDKVFQAVLVKLKENGKTCQEIMEEIDKYPISKELKRKLREFIEEFREGENHEQ